MNPAETIPGSYGIARTTLPDGTVTESIVEQIRYPDGRTAWITVEDRIKQFEERFKDTETQPDTLAPVTTDAIFKEHTTISEGSPTRIHLSAKLVQVLGDPDWIIANKQIAPEKLVHLKKNLSEVSLLRGLCRLAGGKWSTVLSYLPATGF
jgi:hypothetical protein